MIRWLRRKFHRPIFTTSYDYVAKSATAACRCSCYRWDTGPLGYTVDTLPGLETWILTQFEDHLTDVGA